MRRSDKMFLFVMVVTITLLMLSKVSFAGSPTAEGAYTVESTKRAMELFDSGTTPYMPHLTPEILEFYKGMRLVYHETVRTITDFEDIQAMAICTSLGASKLLIAAIKRPGMVTDTPYVTGAAAIMGVTSGCASAYQLIGNLTSDPPKSTKPANKSKLNS